MLLGSDLGPAGKPRAVPFSGRLAEPDRSLPSLARRSGLPVSVPLPRQPGFAQAAALRRSDDGRLRRPEESSVAAAPVEAITAPR